MVESQLKPEGLMHAALCSLVLIVLLGACAREPQVKQAGALRGALANDSWPTYNRTLDGQRYSPLNEITAANVSQLKPACEFGMGEEGGFQAAPS